MDPDEHPAVGLSVQGTRAEIFLHYRALLLSIAYRMLGSMADAEDLVQETFIRWQTSSEADVRSPRAYLVTILSRLCIRQLESARVQREQYVGPWLPEPVSTGAIADPFDASELQESLSMAFLLLLERLTPVERAAFLLHDVFGYAYAELVRILGKSEASCRQIVHRAREHVASNRPRFEPAPEQHERLLQEFVAAASSGNMERLVSVLADEVVLYSDGGGKANAALRPLHGAMNVARFLLGAIAKSVPTDVSVNIEPVNGQPGVVYRFPQGTAGCVLSVVITGQRIDEILVVTNPDKLVHLASRS
jgi:RNA polymerase sigma-70 factor (ECF subfamily)